MVSFHFLEAQERRRGEGKEMEVEGNKQAWLKLGSTRQWRCSQLLLLQELPLHHLQVVKFPWLMMFPATGSETISVDVSMLTTGSLICSDEDDKDEDEDWGHIDDDDENDEINHESLPRSERLISWEGLTFHRNQ
jgi:hypothetical protein